MNRFIRFIRKPIIPGIIFMLSFNHVSCGQSKTDRLDKLLGMYAENKLFNGSVLVAEKGKVIYSKGFGEANMEKKIPNQANTKFRIGSVTKQFTAMLIVQLAAENKLDLQKPISSYLPDYPKKTGDLITIHHLLTHTSGVPNFTDFPLFQEAQGKTYKPEELVRLFSDSALEFKPGSTFSYSNSGYIVLGCLVEKITGKPYEQVLQEKILTPLKMNNTGYDHNQDLKDRASGYDRRGGSFYPSAYVDMSVPFSAGALYSTVEDLFTWDQALYTEKLLPKKYRDLLFNNYISDGDDSYYGYGWFIEESPIGNSGAEIGTVDHSGSINGFNALITRIPSDHSSVILLNNTGGAPLDPMTVAILGILYDKPYDFPKKSIAIALQDVLAKSGIPGAKKSYEEVKNSKDYYLNEAEMNQAGYVFLQSAKAEEAAFLFKINVDEYPHSFNVYDSYGEALMVLGKKEEALENYMKSVQLNPGSASGIKVLNEAGINTDTLVKKVSIDQLKVLEGEYLESGRGWKIKFDIVNGDLVGNDRGYRYKLIPVGDNKFINPDDGASLVFDSRDKNAITLVLFGALFKKVN